MDKLIEEYRNKLININVSDKMKFPLRRILSKKDLEVLNNKIDDILKEFKTMIEIKIATEVENILDGKE